VLGPCLLNFTRLSRANLSDVIRVPSTAAASMGSSGRPFLIRLKGASPS
jgi:hypothetical protein